MTPKEDQQPMTTREELDFTTMSGVDLLDYCRDDASKWAEAFCQIKQKQGWSADDIDEGLMTCWFANAIEHSSDVRSLASRQEVSVGELAGFFATEFPPLMTMSTQIEVARALLAEYSITKRTTEG
jgi:hypothetical protein